MITKNSTRRGVVAGSIRLFALVVGLFMFRHLSFALLLTVILFLALLFAGKIAKLLIWEDVEVNTKSMFRRFLLSCFAGIIWFGFQYYLTYPQREGFYERTRYPTSMLTLQAILVSLFVTFATFVLWYFLLYLIALIKHLKSKVIAIKDDNENT